MVINPLDVNGSEILIRETGGYVDRCVKSCITYNCAVCDIQVIKEYDGVMGILGSEVIFYDDCRKKLKDLVGKL